MVDVVVIGAGVSGLIAARDLERQGRQVTVLEAQSRIGGRCLRQQTIDGWWVDLGGQWIGATHHRLQALTAELGLETFASYFTGNTVHVWDGQPKAAPMQSNWQTSYLDIAYEDLSASPADREAAKHLHQQFFNLVESIDAEQPWKTPQARTLDRQTIDSWMRQRSDSRLAHAVLEWYCRVGGSGGFEPTEASILHLAQTQKSSPQSESPEHALIHGAAGQIPERLAAQLAGEIRTNAAAQRIKQDSDGTYTVTASDGSSHSCHAVVVAIPPALRSRIVFESGLPVAPMRLWQRSPMGSMIKILTVYPTAWRREDGLNGYGQGNLSTVQLTADSSPPSGRPGVMASFVAADRAINISQLSAESRRQAILDDLVHYWGPRAAEPLDYIEKNWSEETWVSGGFSGYMTPGTWTSVGHAWREPVGNIVWAGTESSARWAGYYEGAIQAGLDAAQTVQQLLGAG